MPRGRTFPRLDPSNLKPDYLRNRVRLELLPYLKREYNPAVGANLAETAAILREDEALLERLASDALARCRAPVEGVALLAHVILGEPLALARRVVRMAARMATGSNPDLGLDAVSQVLDLAADSRGTHELHLPGGLTVMVEYGICRFVAGWTAAGSARRGMADRCPRGDNRAAIRGTG